MMIDSTLKKLGVANKTLIGFSGGRVFGSELYLLKSIYFASTIKLRFEYEWLARRT